MTENVSHNTSFDSLESKPTPQTDQLVGEADPDLFDAAEIIEPANFGHLSGKHQ